MAIIVAEYLGHRTDSITPIKPVPYPFSQPIPLCPFNKLPCKKMNMQENANFPICSLWRKNQLYIVCEHRLASTSSDVTLPISPYQADVLHKLAQEVFDPNIKLEEVAFKPEVTMKSGHNADYIMGVTPSVIHTYGHRKLIVEIQGGGETSNTGVMTRTVISWTNSNQPDNQSLSAPLKKVGLIQTNAWRRLQEQLLAKASVASVTGYGFVACVGTILFDYVSGKLNNFSGIGVSKNSNWDIAIIAYCQDAALPVRNGPIPLKIDQSRILYTTFNQLATLLIGRGSNDPEAFSGDYRTLTGRTINLP